MISNEDQKWIEDLFKSYGYEEYYGNSWIKTEWVTERKPYDRMAIGIDYLVKKIKNKIQQEIAEKNMQIEKLERILNHL